MKTVELFAGIGGFRLAAERLGWKTVWANDASEKACMVYSDKFGDQELKQGDFTTLVATVPQHDMLTGGFPCQPFSSAGKKEGIRDARGTLFQLIVDVLKMRRPKFFVLENVKRLLTMEGGRHFATILGSLADLDYLIEWRLVNAMNFGLPQNRERVAITGSLAPGKHRSTPMIRLASANDFPKLNHLQHELIASPSKWPLVTDHNARFPSWGLAIAGRFFGMDLDKFTAAQPTVSLGSILQESVPEQFDFTESTLRWIHENDPVNRIVNGVEIISNQRGGARMGYTIFGTNGVAPTLTSTTSRHYERYSINGRYRRLTNIEYARIQGFPDDHCRAAAPYDQYQLLGNAVPPPLAEWAMQQVVTEGLKPHDLPLHIRHMPLFDNDKHNNRSPGSGSR